MIELNKIIVEELATIELLDAKNKIYPINFVYDNVIYCIHNKINDKNYIGQTTQFRNRFSDSYVGHFRDYELYLNGNEKKNRAIYNAWEKYGLESFIVYIIDTGKNREELNNKEKLWIKQLHTCTKDPDCFGYNLTWGADDLGGLISEKSIQKSISTRIEKYGSACSPNCHTPEAFAKGNKTKEEKYGYSGFINAFTPEANKKRIETNLQRYGKVNGPGPSKEAINRMVEDNIKKYGNYRGKLGTPDVITKTRCFQIIYTIDKRLSSVTSFNEYCELVMKTYSNKRQGRKHIISIKEDLSNLRNYKEKWTEKHESIFGVIEDLSIEDININLDSINERIIKENRKKAGIAVSITKKNSLIPIFKSIDKIFKKSNIETWENYYKAVRSIYGRKLHRTKEHLIRIIDSLSKLKQDPRWTPKHESIFGHLTEADKEKINSLKKGENLL